MSDAELLKLVKSQLTIVLGILNQTNPNEEELYGCYRILEDATNSVLNLSGKE